MASVQWSDDVEDVLAGDITAGLACVTPAGGAVVTPVATVGLRDRAAGTVAFTTSLGFGRKLERLRRNPKVALAYHAREYGFASAPGYVLVQGVASVDLDPDPQVLQGIRPAAERFLGPVKQGKLFWSHWLREYYEERVVVTVDVVRVTTWPSLACEGAPQVEGRPPASPPMPQAPPKQGTAARVDAARAAQRLGRLNHQLLGYVDGDGFPMVVPVRVTPSGTVVRLATAAPLPEGGRRAGLLAHSYRARLIGLAVRQHTGWLSVDPGTPGADYSPHTEKGFRAPPNKTLLLFFNGLLAKQSSRRARKAPAGARVGAP